MQDEIVSHLANTLDAQLTEEEARRSERSLHPSSMDLYFQGRASCKKGFTPEYMAQARRFFERALALDPGNTEAIVGTAVVDTVVGTNSFVDDRAAYLAAAETTVVKVLSHVPNHAFAHLILGVLQIVTNRAVQGMAECERALALDRNLVEAHALIGAAKIAMGRSAETEAHINEAFRLSPRDVDAYRWLFTVGVAKMQLSEEAEAVGWFRRSIEANPNYPYAHFYLAGVLALHGSLDQASAAAKAGLAILPSFTIRRFRNGVESDPPTCSTTRALAKRERIYQGMRMAGIPEG